VLERRLAPLDGNANSGEDHGRRIQNGMRREDGEKTCRKRRRVWRTEWALPRLLEGATTVGRTARRKEGRGEPRTNELKNQVKECKDPIEVRQD
jgi:hypothetical protein